MTVRQGRRLPKRGKMDPISKFFVSYKIPIGEWGKAFFTFLTDNFNTFFRGL